VFETGKSRRFGAILTVATPKLTLLHAAETLDFLASSPGNHLEALRGDRKGRHRIRFNERWRICFRCAGCRRPGSTTSCASGAVGPPIRRCASRGTSGAMPTRG